MNKVRSMIVGFLLVFMFVVSINNTALAAKEQFATVNINQIFDEYEKTKEFDTGFRTQGRIKQEERDAIVHEIRRLRDEQELLSEDGRAGKQEEVNVKLKELDSFDLQTKRLLGEKRNTAIREVFQDIESVLETYGERKGYDLILNDRALLYRDKRFDVTSDILTELNRDYEKNRS